MKIKTIFTKSLLLLLLCGTLAAPLIAGDRDDLGDIDMDLMDLDLDIDLDKLPPKNSRAPITDLTAFGLGGLLRQIKLDEPLWSSTKPEKGRDILYLMPSKITAIEYGGGSCNFFFNMTPKMYLTGSNLLNIEQVDPVQLGARIPMGLTTNPEQVGSLLPFIKKITIQERKVGPFFQTGFTKNAFTLQFHTSLQLGERNFWLNRHDLEEVKALNQLIFGDDQSYDESQLYRIRVGMGDTRVKIGLNALNAKKIQTDVGLECIIPTSRSSKKTIPEPLDDAQLNDDVTIFNHVVNSLLHVRDYLLTPEIGNGGHFGLGFYLESKIDLFKNLAELITRVSFDKFFEADEQRLMLQKKTLTYVDLENTPPGNHAEAQRRVIGFAKQYLIPQPYRVSIEPGGIFNGIMILHIPYKKWDIRYGYDFYFQQAERFKQVHAPSGTVQLLDSNKARVGSVIQHKISSETTYRIKNFNNINLDVGFGGDTTISAYNIGKDWTFYLKLASAF